jgi:putative ABC transport system permease protein
MVLGVGIAASAVSFSVIYGLAFRPLPLPDSRALFGLAPSSPEAGLAGLSIAEARQITESLGALGIPVATYYRRGATLRQESHTDRIVMAPVSADFFRVLGSPPQVGRTILSDDDYVGSERVVVISDSLWRVAYGGDPNIVGGNIELDNERYQVVGVMPPSFTVPDNQVSVWSAIEPTFGTVLRSSNLPILRLVGRLPEGATLQQVRAVATTVVADPAGRDEDRRSALTVLPLSQFASIHLRTGLLILALASAALLGVACLAALTLQLSEFKERQREVALRAALGAPAKRLILQQLLESGRIAVAAGVIGLLLASWTLSAVRTIGVAAIPELSHAELDWRVLLFAGHLVLIAVIIVSLAPIAAVRLIEPAAALKEGAPTMSHTRGGSTLRDFLLAASVAMSLALVVGSVALASSLAGLLRTDLGYQPDRVVRALVRLPYQVVGPEERNQIALLADQLLESARRLPGIGEVAMAAVSPGQWYLVTTRVSAADAEPGPGTEIGLVQVSPNYFRTLAVPILRGREFEVDDRRDKPEVVVLDVRAAIALFGHEAPVGERLRFEQWGSEAEVVGIVQTARLGGRGTPHLPQVFVPFAQHALPHIAIIARMEGPAIDVQTTMRTVVGTIDPTLPVTDVRYLTDVVDDERQRPLFYAVTISALGGLAAVLACVGLYATIAALVASRRRELAVMLALGARPSWVARRVIRRTVTVSTIGVIAGWPLAALTIGLLRSQVYGVTGASPMMYLQGSAVIWLTALVAAYLPAHHAASASPAEALRT